MKVARNIWMNNFVWSKQKNKKDEKMFSYGTTVSPRVRIHSQMFINLWKGWKSDDFWDGGFWSEVFMFFSHFYKVATKLDWTKFLMRNHVNNFLSFFSPENLKRESSKSACVVSRAWAFAEGQVRCLPRLHHQPVHLHGLEQRRTHPRGRR